MKKSKLHTCSFCHRLGETTDVVVQYHKCDTCDPSEYTIKKNGISESPVSVMPQVIQRQNPMPPGVDKNIFTPPLELKL